MNNKNALILVLIHYNQRFIREVEELKRQWVIRIILKSYARAAKLKLKEALSLITKDLVPNIIPIKKKKNR